MIINNNKTVFLRFEASVTIGAGHAIRCCVLGDALVEQGWICKIITTQESYDFIANLSRFDRIEPDVFYHHPSVCDLLVVDYYDLDESYEQHFRQYAKKIMVIDDLANRKHDCDILLDQTDGRDASDYQVLVPEHCKVLAGGDYILLRRAFLKLRPKALEKRRRTTEVKRILVSLGGSDPQNHTLKALEMIKESGFQGAIDIVLGFTAQHLQSVQDHIDKLPNKCKIYIDPDMPKLMYEADLAIGASGSSVWERCCLGLPQYIMQTAENQSTIFKKYASDKFETIYNNGLLDQKTVNLPNKVDGLGFVRALNYIEEKRDRLGRLIHHKRVHEEDIDLIFQWQQNTDLRNFSINKISPSPEQHEKWFHEKLKDTNSIFEKIMVNKEPCGTLRLDYCANQDAWNLSWYIVSEFQKNGIGSIALEFSKRLCVDKDVSAVVFKDNMASRLAMAKAGFRIASEDEKKLYYASSH